MKSLYESLLDDEDEIVDKLDIKPLIEEWLNKHSVKSYIINKDNTINVRGNLKLLYHEEEELPSYIQFGKVSGGFTIYRSKLKTLKGAPKKVGMGFICSECDNLTSLEGAPKEVGGYFECNECNNLTSLEGAPKKVGGNFVCSYCGSLQTLEGAPKEVGRIFDCQGCCRVTSLKGAPEKVGGILIVVVVKI